MSNINTGGPYSAEALEKAEALAGDLELVPMEQDEFTKKLQRAGFAAVSERSQYRSESEES